jgi:DNA segregation ATPase FtsK/SpoIIIE-like protein
MKSTHFNDDSQMTSREYRLARKLEIQSQHIERLLARHETDAQVSGGMVRSASTSFDLREKLSIGLERLRHIGQDLKQSMGVDQLSLDRVDGRLQIRLSRAEDDSLALMNVLSMVSHVPPVTATLGLSELGRPVLLELASADASPVLLSGDQGSGKAALLRTLAVSLTLANRQSLVQLAVISADSPAGNSSYTLLEPLSYLPHMIAPVIYGEHESYELLAFLAGEMAYRREQGVNVPSLVVIVDGYVSLIERGGRPVADLVAQLAQQGFASGIHLVASTRRPDASSFEEAVRSSLPARIVGRTRDERMANIAAGTAGRPAKYLADAGQFVAILNGNTATHFHAASLGHYDMCVCLDELQRAPHQALLARPVCARDMFLAAGESTISDVDEPQGFDFDGETVSWSAGDIEHASSEDWEVTQDS